MCRPRPLETELTLHRESSSYIFRKVIEKGCKNAYCC